MFPLIGLTLCFFPWQGGHPFALDIQFTLSHLSRINLNIPRSSHAYDLDLFLGIFIPIPRTFPNLRLSFNSPRERYR